jgi:hypothetical protein
MLPVHQELIHSTFESIPSEAWIRSRSGRSRHSEWARSLGSPIDAVLPDLKRGFPLTVGALCQHWDKPVAYVKKGERDYMFGIILFQDARAIVTLPGPLEYADYHDEYFEDGACMLPQRWRDLYRGIDSFCVDPESPFQSDWLNTPFAFSSRKEIGTFIGYHNKPEKLVKELAARLGDKKDKVRCWMMTDAGDALFINETRNEASDIKRVYHVHIQNPTDVHELADPETTLDQYLAHYVSGGSPASFDFRKPPA